MGRLKKLLLLSLKAFPIRGGLGGADQRIKTVRALCGFDTIIFLSYM
ncbi:hypothetical protein ABIB50_003624 [Mucilaginibacter sp. UYCu711]